MIEPILVRRLAALAIFLGGVVSIPALLAGSPRIAGGFAAGTALGLLPIVSWSILGGLLLGARAPLLFGAISLGKLLVYAAALALLVGRNLVDPLALAGAMLVPGLLLAVAVTVRRPEAAR